MEVVLSKKERVLERLSWGRAIMGALFVAMMGLGLSEHWILAGAAAILIVAVVWFGWIESAKLDDL